MDVPEYDHSHGDLSQTHWSIIEKAADRNHPESKTALNALCETYWKPVYGYIFFQNRNPHEAADLTQFFFSRVIEKNFFGAADRNKGRFRAYLRVAVKNFLHSHNKSKCALKRGGGRYHISLDAFREQFPDLIEPSNEMTSEMLFDIQWARTILANVLELLAKYYRDKSLDTLFSKLRPFLMGESGAITYKQMALELGSSEGAVKMSVTRMRKKLKKILREEIARTVADPAQIDEEIEHLMAVLGRR
ncbi:MAG: sigma-70 family RNA polymerase sigma factor [Planctomycetes bacterium]|nr:sigma-70 family RNA polymerase sigma factor [Planctomycetota bacterium]